MAIERISISDLKIQMAQISDRLPLKGVAKFNLTKDIDAEWTLMSIGDDGTMKFVHGPVGMREMNSWLDGIIWMINQKEAGLL